MAQNDPSCARRTLESSGSKHTRARLGVLKGVGIGHVGTLADSLPAAEGSLYDWPADSSCAQESPFPARETHESLGIAGEESCSIACDDSPEPLSELEVVRAGEGNFQAKVRLDTPVEVENYRNGGILHTAQRKLATAK